MAARDEADPLVMAENCAAAVLRVAKLQESDPVQSYIARLGNTGKTSAELAGDLALVSIARDLRRVVERLMDDGEQ